VTALTARDLFVSVRRGAGPRRPLLDGVTVEVREGEIVVVTGPSGAGKTTLLSCLAGLSRPTSGSVAIAGVDLGRLRPSARAALRARHVALVQQGDDLLPSLTVRENVELVHRVRRERPDDHVVEQVLDHFGLRDRSDESPEVLSGGERRRVALARMALQPARLIAVDEPTVGLDARSREAVLRLLQARARSGCGVVLVTHDAEAAVVADRILVLRAGKIALQETAPTRESAARLFGTQTGSSGRDGRGG